MSWRSPSSPPLYFSAHLLNSVASGWRPWEPESLRHLETHGWKTKNLITQLNLPNRNQLPDPGLREVCSNSLLSLLGHPSWIFNRKRPTTQFRFHKKIYFIKFTISWQFLVLGQRSQRTISAANHKTYRHSKTFQSSFHGSYTVFSHQSWSEFLFQFPRRGEREKIKPNKKIKPNRYRQSNVDRLSPVAYSWIANQNIFIL